MPYAIREIPTKLTQDEAARFWSYVDLPPSADECWNWRGAARPLGYGMFGLRGEAYGTHRISYTLARGPIPDGLVLDHLCRNPRCINPAHLEPVTQRENVLRGDARLTKSPDERCPKGHEPNWMQVQKHGPDRPKTRVCRGCFNERARRRTARRRELSGG